MKGSIEIKLLLICISCGEKRKSACGIFVFFLMIFQDKVTVCIGIRFKLGIVCGPSDMEDRIKVKKKRKK